MRTIIGLGGALALTFGLCAAASAQERPNSYFSEHVRAPSGALELKIGTGYTQGFGNIAPSRTLQDVGSAGLGVSLDLDYRLSHHWSLGVEAQYQQLTPQQNTTARGMAANVGGTYHFAPVLRGDPWLRLGTGYRLVWEVDPSGSVGVNQLRHGFELVSAKVGYDVRVSDSVAIAPVIGADLNTFLWENPSAATNGALSSAQVGTFVYAGLQGRFDIGGKRGGVAEEPVVTSATVPPPPPPQPVVAPPPLPAPPPPAQPETTRVAPSITVSRDIMDQCRLTMQQIDKTPKFEFDQAELLPADFAALKEIAECFSTGPMKGLNMILVGRADPRGTIAHNEALGMKRATNVATYLQIMGVHRSQVEPTSRGKLDATGYDEATWAIDRRVDILVGPH